MSWLCLLQGLNFPELARGWLRLKFGIDSGRSTSPVHNNIILIFYVVPGYSYLYNHVIAVYIITTLHFQHVVCPFKPLAIIMTMCYGVQGTVEGK